MHTAYLGLGSNLGNKTANLANAVNKLNESEFVSVIKVSSHFHNPAIEGAGPEQFINQVIKLETSFNPQALLAFILEIENKIDPERNSRGRKKARIIDIDLLLFNDESIDSPELIIPHPRMQERDFVMMPLQEIKDQ